MIEKSWIRRMVEQHLRHRVACADMGEVQSTSQMKIDFFTRNGLFIFSHNNSIPLATLLEWYKIRDTFFGDNYVSQNIPLALELASSCQHPDARWLTEACAGKGVTTKEDGKRVFSALGQNDARALCLFGFLVMRMR
jgi:hypothetical protein